MAVVLGCYGRVADRLAEVVKDHPKVVLTVVIATVGGVAIAVFQPTLLKTAFAKSYQYMWKNWTKTVQLAQKNPKELKQAALIVAAGLVFVWIITVTALVTLGYVAAQINPFKHR